jgi:hypothetical protein
MKPTTLLPGRLLLAVLAIVLTAGLISWDQQQSPGRYQQAAADTTPKKKDKDREKKVRDLDDVLDELERNDWEADMLKAKKEIAEAMKNFDGEKIRLEIEKAMREVDMAKIQKEIQESLAKVDYDKIKNEIATALKEIDVAKIQKEVEASMEKVNWDNIKMEMDKVKDIDMKKLETDMKKLGEEMKELGPKLEKEMQKAKIEMEKAKADIKEFKTFVEALDKEGLINKKEGYTLLHKDGELFINGKKAAEETYSKYKDFLKKHKKFNIEKSDDDFDMNLD